MKDDLINMDLHCYSSYIRNNNINSLKFHDLSKYYYKYKINNSKLDELKEDFYIEQLKVKLEINDSSWDNSENYLLIKIIKNLFYKNYYLTNLNQK